MLSVNCECFKSGGAGGKKKSARNKDLIKNLKDLICNLDDESEEEDCCNVCVVPVCCQPPCPPPCPPRCCCCCCCCNNKPCCCPQPPAECAPPCLPFTIKCPDGKDGKDAKDGATCMPPCMMLCVKKNGDGGGAGAGVAAARRLKESKSRELRASILHCGCDCEKRNGLQDDCQRTECQGSPDCLKRPPICGPSAYAGFKHYEARRWAKKDGAKGGAAGGATDNEEYDCYPAYFKMNCCSPCVPATTS